MDIDVVFLLKLVLTVVVAVVSIACCYASRRKHRHTAGRSLSGLELLQNIHSNITKALPISLSTEWKLDSYHHGHRVWHRDVRLRDRDQSCTPPTSESHDASSTSSSTGGASTASATAAAKTQTIAVIGCAAKIKGSSQSILSALKDSHNYSEWDPYIHSLKHICTGASSVDADATTSHRAAKRNAATCALYSQHDVVSIERDTAHVPALMRVVNQVSQRLQGEALLRRIDIISRYWHKEENSCCWFLEMNEAEQEWTMFVMQPVEGLFEIDQCLLTIMSGRSTVSSWMSEHAALRLATIQEYFFYRKVQVVPLNVISLPESGNVGSDADTHATPNASPSLKTRKAKPEDGDKQKGEGEAAKTTEISFMQKVRTMIDEKKEWYEERKRKTSSNSAKSDTAVVSIMNHIPVTESTPPRRHGSTATAGGDEEKWEVIEGEEEDITDSKSSRESEGGIKTDDDEVIIETDDEEKSKQSISAVDDSAPLTSMASLTAALLQRTKDKRSLLQLLRSNTAPALGNDSSSSTKRDDSARVSDEIPAQDVPITGSTTRTTRRIMQRAMTIDVIDNVKDKPDLGTKQELEESLANELSLIKAMPEDERLVAGYCAVAKQATKEILLEKSRLSFVNINQPPEKQPAEAGGWVYCGLEKDVVILRKIYDDGTPLQSYLGKGLIQAHPNAVFEAIKSPHTRFTYDDMLKKTDVIHDFGNGMKILYLYHEVSQLFRKECRDFCVLQTEHKESSKYILSLRSVGWPGCEESEAIPRAKFLPSGWIIEPALKDKKVFSMVTYIVQLELGSNKSTSGYLIEELAAKQPLSIAYLRQYLAPSSVTRSASTATPPRSITPQSSASKRRLSAPQGALTSTLASTAARFHQDERDKATGPI